MSVLFHNVKHMFCAFEEGYIHGRKDYAVRQLNGHLVHLEELRVDGFHVFHHLLCIATEGGPDHVVALQPGFCQVTLVHQREVFEETFETIDFSHLVLAVFIVPPIPFGA